MLPFLIFNILPEQLHLFPVHFCYPENQKSNVCLFHISWFHVPPLYLLCICNTYAQYDSVFRICIIYVYYSYIIHLFNTHMLSVYVLCINNMYMYYAYNQEKKLSRNQYQAYQLIAYIQILQ